MNELTDSKKELKQIEGLKTVRGEKILSIRYQINPSGDTKIFIKTDKSIIVLGANDLGAWLEKIIM